MSDTIGIYLFILEQSSKVGAPVERRFFMSMTSGPSCQTVLGFEQQSGKHSGMPNL
jgi:hypothetical protein